MIRGMARITRIARIAAFGLTLAVAAIAADAVAADRGDVREAQRLLNALGYDAGPVDGLIGRQVRGAVRDFQSDMGAGETGVVDDRLLETLRRATEPPPPPVEPPVSAAIPPGAVLQPARPDPSPVTTAPPAAAKPTLSGQTWRFDDSDGAAMTLTFLADGRISGPAFATGFAWRQDGDDLWLTYESPLGGRTTRQGRLESDSVMSGDGQSADGPSGGDAARAWSWNATRIR